MMSTLSITPFEITINYFITLYKALLSIFQIKGEDGNIYPMKFCMVINCAGPWAGEIGRLAGLGIDEDVLKVPIPVEPR